MGTGFYILCFVALVICVLIGFEEGSWDLGLGTIAFIVSAMISALVILIIMAASIFLINTEVTEAPTETIKLEALKDNSNIQGQFFLGSGTIDEKVYYYFLAKEEHGIKQNKLSADSSYLNYTEGEPYIEEYGMIPSGWYGKFMFGKEPVDYYYKIYVPEGSITNEFKVDLE